MNRKLLAIAVILSLVSITTIAVTAEENVFYALNSAIDSAVDAVTSLTYARQPKSADKAEPQRDDVATPADTETSIDTKTTVAEINTRLIKGIWGFGTNPEAKGEFRGSYSSHIITGEVISETGDIIFYVRIKLHPTAHSLQKYCGFSGQITYADESGKTIALRIKGLFGLSGKTAVAFWNIIFANDADRSVSLGCYNVENRGWFFGEIEDKKLLSATRSSLKKPVSVQPNDDCVETTATAEITRAIKGIWGLGTNPEAKGEFHGSYSSHLIAGELIDEYGNIIANAKFEVQPATHLTQTVHVFSGQITYADKCGNTYATSITGKFSISGKSIVVFWSTVSPTTVRFLTQDSCKAYTEGWFFGEVA